MANWAHVRTLVAVSGGSDSVGLLCAMAALVDQFDSSLRSNLIVAHIDHQIRGDESDADADFVRELARSRDLELLESKADGTTTTRSEESLRDFRYRELLKWARQHGARYIVTGHNLDDQVETILFRFFRGTGIGGLRGIPARRLAYESITLVRPLLEISRVEIEAYLASIQQSFRTDSSNADTKYARNYLRHELLPELKSRFGDSVTQSVLRLGEQAAEIDEYLDVQATVLDFLVLQRSVDRLVVDCKHLSQHPPVLIRHWLNRVWTQQAWPRQAMTAAWWRRISEAMVNDANQILNLPCEIRFETTNRIASFHKGK